jgi:hypothetical protein
MSFDVFLFHFEKGIATGASKAAVKSLLQSVRHSGPDSSGVYLIKFRGCEDVEFVAKGLDSTEPLTECAFFLQTFEQDVTDFMFEVARAGTMAIVPAMKGDVVAIPQEAIRGELPDELKGSRIVYLKEPRELGLLLRDGFEAWQKYVAGIRT